LPPVLSALITFAAAEAAKPDKTAFYIAGGALVLFALTISFIGIRGIETFPASKGQARGVMALSVLLVAATMAAAVLTG
jgi:hypothetical protein